jgi:predicted amidohydrolase
MKHKVGLAQISPLLGNVEKNMAICRDAVARAQAIDCSWVVLPELALSGYMLRDLVPEVALTLDSEPIEELSALSARIAITTGFVEETPDGRFCNSAAHFEKGRIAHVHRKAYLPTYGMFDEGRYFAPGDRIRAFDSEFGRLGLMICEDAWHLSIPYVLAQDGAEILVILSSSPARGVRGEHIESSQAWGFIVRVYSELLRCYVLYANRAGYEEGVSFSGASRASSPGGATIAEGPPLDEELVTVEISSHELRRARLATPLHRDERLELTMRELERIADGRYRGPF